MGSQDTQEKRRSAYIALGSAVTFWGLSFVATKIALQTFPTFTLIFGRFSISACLFIPIITG